MRGRSRFRSVLAACGSDPTMMIAGTVGEASVAGWWLSIAAIGLVSASLNEDASAARTKQNRPPSGHVPLSVRTRFEEIQTGARSPTSVPDSPMFAKIKSWFERKTETDPS